MGDVVTLNNVWHGDVDPGRVIEGASEQHHEGPKFKDVIVIGILEDGSAYYATTHKDMRHCAWDVRRFERWIHEVQDANEIEGSQ